MTERRPIDPLAKPGDDVLVAVAQATAKVADDIREDATAARRRPAPPSQWKNAAAGLLAVITIALWAIFPPPPPDTRDPRSPARIEDDLRMTVGALATQINDFRLAKGRLPESLDAAGAPSQTVRYKQLDGSTYMLIGADNGATLTYKSTTPLAEFTALEHAP